MNSSDSADRLDLERDLPTTPRDVEMLHRLRTLPRMTDADYLAFLASFPAPPASVLRRRSGPRGEPFELP